MADYPPDRHLLRDLRFTMLSAPGLPDRVLMPVVPELSTASGAPSLGALAVAVDLAAAGVAMRTIAPDWLATAELEIHARAPARASLAVAEPSLLRSGRTTTVFEVEVKGYSSEEAIDQEPGVPLAHSTMTFVRITRPDATHSIDHPQQQAEPMRADFALEGSGLTRPFFDELGMQTVDASRGVIEMPSDPFSKNSFESLQGGLVATLAQAACEAATAARCGAPAEALDISVHYLAQGRGPYATRADLIRGTKRSSVHRVEIVDQPTGTLMATATTASAIAE